MSTHIIDVIEDEPAVARVFEHWITKRWGYTARIFPDGESFFKNIEANNEPDLVLSDIMLPGMNGIEILKKLKTMRTHLPVIMISAQAQIDTAVDALRFGASDYFSKPVDFNRLAHAIKTALEVSQLTREVERLRSAVEETIHFDNIISNDGAMQEVFKLVKKAKDSDITVLIQGESGTGKELVARALHFNGKRKDSSFVVMNCAAIPRELLESELFGHERGSFTGAVQRRIGKFEQANNGTLFLDEIGELDPGLQAKLLRVIQSGDFERVGGNETIRSDVRLITSTNRDLRKEVEQGNFREDLFFRLSTFPILVPPLRQRRGDILPLAEHFLRRFVKESGKGKLTFSRNAMKKIYQYPWPGNVRELENAIERAVVLVEGEILTENDLPLTVTSFSAQQSGDVPAPTAFDETSPVLPLERVKEMAIRHAMKATDGNIADAAGKLQIGRATFYRLLKKFKIDVPR